MKVISLLSHGERSHTPSTARLPQITVGEVLLATGQTTHSALSEFSSSKYAQLLMALAAPYPLFAHPRYGTSVQVWRHK